MVARAGTGQQSFNAGEFAPDLAGRIDIKQYYSAGLRYYNVVPIAQGGFAALPGTRRLRPVNAAQAPRFWRLRRSATATLFVAVLPGRVDIFAGSSLAASVAVPALTAPIAATASLYLEADTIGIFHADLRSVRLVRQGSDSAWAVSSWPYAKIPKVQYGGAYAKVADVWDIYLRWEQYTGTIDINMTVDGESTPGIGYELSSDGQANGASVAAALQAALEQLPSLGPGVTVSYVGSPGTGSALMRAAFDGALTGIEYDVTARVLNTAQASALPTHRTIGRTIGEDAISTARGWPGVVALSQDRLIYAALKAKPSAILMSQAAEYFDVNIEAQRKDGAKLESLRTNSKETILHVKDSKYLLVFTDEAEYFATNRVIARDEPMNFLETSRNGLQAGTWPVEIENRVYYVGQRGKVVFSTAYDDIASAFTARMESLLAPHLVDNVVMTELQRGTDDTEAPRLWLLRGDGRLVGACVLRDQEICAFFEYDPGAPVRSIGLDPDNRLWLAVARPEGLIYEIIDPATALHCGVTATTDAAGAATGLPFADGAEVWAETADGYTIGPFAAAGGQVATGWPSTAMRLGLWTAPLWRSMPRVLLTASDQVVRRPGRIHTLDVTVIDTDSIAIGANGSAPVDVALLRPSDPVDAPMPRKSERITVSGIPGVVDEPTAVITQLRPGRLRVRDITFGEKL